MRSLWMVFALMIGVITPAIANIIEVPSAHSTIQAGINAAAPGDTVRVGPGTYTGPLNRNLDFAGKNIVLQSSAGPAATTIDCQNLGRGIHFHQGETAAAVVEGFTIRNGSASGAFGGGIWIEGGATPTVRNCRLDWNHANTGGGVYVSSGAHLIDCVFASNTADNWGGGVYGETGTLQILRCAFTTNAAGVGAGFAARLGATATLIDCVFTENDPGSFGGGLFSSAAAVGLLRCTFQENTGTHGAGAYLVAGAASVDSCAFIGNTSNYSGGGLYAEEVENLRVTRSRFEDNTTLSRFSTFPYGGGGLYVFGQSLALGPYIGECDFVGNRSLGESTAGGGLRCGPLDQALIERCTFSSNESEGAGGGAASSGQLQGCSFEGNSGFTGGGLHGGKAVVDCRFVGNHAVNGGGGCFLVGGNVPGGSILRCEFVDNTAGSGGGVYWDTAQPLTIGDSRFVHNVAFGGGGLSMFPIGPASITGCTFDRNQSNGSGAVQVVFNGTPAPVAFSHCTLVGNRASSLFGSAFRLLVPVEISNTIIAFGQGTTVECVADGMALLSCTAIFGNTIRNWTDCIDEQQGINGNFQLDPLFCDLASEDYTLAENSPCSPDHSPGSCGLIGAHPVGCAAQPVGITDTGAPAVTPVLHVTPNPIRGSGMIEWSGGVGPETELRLYDVAGRLVAQRAEAGAAGHLPWSSLVETGGVASGIYFLEIGAEHSTDTRVRLVVIR